MSTIKTITQMIRVNVKRVNGKTHYIITLPKGSYTHTNEDDDAWLDRLTEEQLQQLYEAEHENDGKELPEMSEDEDESDDEIEYNVKLMQKMM